jgi:hypothetical protein
MCNGLWNTWKTPIMALSKSSIITDQWGLKFQFSDKSTTENDEKLSIGSDTDNFCISREDWETDTCELHIRRSFLLFHVYSEHENLSWSLKKSLSRFSRIYAFSVLLNTSNFTYGKVVPVLL